MQIFIAIIIFVVAYVISKFLLEKVDSLRGIAEILAIAIGALLALIYVGAIQV